MNVVTAAGLGYEGTMAAISTGDSKATSTITLRQVRCLGSEGRLANPVPRSNDIYDLIVFKGSDMVDMRFASTTSPMVPAEVTPEAPSGPKFEKLAPPSDALV